MRAYWTRVHMPHGNAKEVARCLAEVSCFDDRLCIEIYVDVIVGDGVCVFHELYVGASLVLHNAQK